MIILGIIYWLSAISAIHSVKSVIEIGISCLLDVVIEVLMLSLHEPTFVLYNFKNYALDVSQLFS